MSSSYVHIQGNLGKDPEFVQKGENSYCKFSVAVNQREKDGTDKTTWFAVATWRGAEACAKHLKKGSGVNVRGRLNLREYEHNGAKRISPDVIADHVEFTDRRVGDGAVTRDATLPASPKDDLDDLAF